LSCGKPCVCRDDARRLPRLLCVEEYAAWYPRGHELAHLSPRDPKHLDPNAVCEARDRATTKLRNPREDITDVMRAYGITRRNPKHWA